MKSSKEPRAEIENYEQLQERSVEKSIERIQVLLNDNGSSVGQVKCTALGNKDFDKRLYR
jgi:hypothetical protein